MLLQIGQLLSNLGTQAASIAYPLFVLALTHSAVKAGLVSFARTLPLALFAIPAGVAADRWSRKALMITADAGRVVAVGILVISIITKHTPFWLIPLIAFVEGGGAALFTAAQAGALRATVPRSQLPEAAGAQTGRAAVVRVAGPPAGGALFEVARALPFVADVVSYAFSTLSLLWMRTPFQEERTTQLASLRDRVKEGLAFIWSQPFVRTSAFLYGLLNFISPGVFFAVIVIAKRQALSSGAVGGLVASFGVAVLVGSIASPALRRRLSVRAVMRLEIWAWLGCALFLIWPSVYVLTASILPVGFAIPSTDSVVNGYRIAITPDRLLGRAESVRSAIALMIASLAPLVAGFLLADTTPRWTIAFFAVFALGLAIWGTFNQSIRDVPSLDDLDRHP
jgi:MFS family permease